MSTPMIYDRPIKRPNFVQQVNWIGDDDDLSLQLSFYNSQGQLQSMSMTTQNAERKGEVCLPNSNDVADLADTDDRIRDILAAHVRMAMQIKGFAIPGSQEFADAILESLLGSNHLNTAVGTTKVSDVGFVDDQFVDLTFKQGSGPARKYRFDYSELSNYQYVPQTQLLVAAGAIKKEFNTARHDHPSEVLTQSEKDGIAEYILGMSFWM